MEAREPSAWNVVGQDAKMRALRKYEERPSPPQERKQSGQQDNEPDELVPQLPQQSGAEAQKGVTHGSQCEVSR